MFLIGSLWALTGELNYISLTDSFGLDRCWLVACGRVCSSPCPASLAFWIFWGAACKWFLIRLWELWAEFLKYFGYTRNMHILCINAVQLHSTLKVKSGLAVGVVSLRVRWVALPNFQSCSLPWDKFKSPTTSFVPIHTHTKPRHTWVMWEGERVCVCRRAYYVKRRALALSPVAQLLPPDVKLNTLETETS